MTLKAPVRNEHVELYLEGKFDEIPENLLLLVKERVEAMGKRQVDATVKLAEENALASLGAVKSTSAKLVADEQLYPGDSDD